MIALAAAAVWQWRQIEASAGYVASRFRAKATVADRLAQYEDEVRERLAADFKRAGVAWPATRLTFLAFKEERRLEVWAGAETDGAWRHIKTYPIKAASGAAGPKLREGDMQVPEGFYGIESLNPNSRYHLALRINYPGEFDRARAREDGRARLGGDIMIHGKAVSAGCLAMGDAAAEELFVMSALAGIKNIRVLLCPRDLRRLPANTPPDSPPWLRELYAALQKEVAKFKL
jgi:hypothetical protein